MTLTMQASCARSGGSEVDADPLLAPPESKNPVALAVCVSTDCPAPWATCGDAGLCKTNTSRDIEHCGACGNACPSMPKSFHATPVCSKSTCTIACDELSADCNHDAADGCEVFTGDDPKNCGGCGNVCKDGELCWKGACGCPSGFTQCGNDCKNLQSDGLNCGSCGKHCVAPPSNDPEWICGPSVQPDNTGWGCAGGTCKIACEPLFGDCDANLCSNGCETDLTNDPLHCGSCTRACGANQQCVNGTCLCPSGTTRCGNRCVDLGSDASNCGACGNGCDGAEGGDANGIPTCTKGRCGYLCYAGFADCDHRIDNGCEVEIGTDPLHCGSCTTKCDGERGQPCVEGKCLTKPCGPGPGVF
ncbi:MAG: Tryptophan synthase alpha chain [Labilithrix sp.]|nr:Tryptophan synthase alpha chain [Labilithrix sp.]